MALKTKEEILKRFADILKIGGVHVAIIEKLCFELSSFLDDESVRAICSNEGFFASLGDVDFSRLSDPFCSKVGIDLSHGDNPAEFGVTSLSIYADYPVSHRDNETFQSGITCHFYLDKEENLVFKMTCDEVTDRSNNPNLKDIMQRFMRNCTSEHRLFNQNGIETGRNYSRRTYNTPYRSDAEYSPSLMFRLNCPRDISGVEKGGTTRIVFRDFDNPLCLRLIEYDRGRIIKNVLCFADTQRTTLNGSIVEAFDLINSKPLLESVREFLQKNPGVDLETIRNFIGSGGHMDSTTMSSGNGRKM